MKRVVIVIPVHKSNPSPNEIASLKQCYKILGKHPIKLVSPEGLDMSAYQDAVPNPEIVSIDPVWLSSIEQYNKLKISKYFYKLFRDYEFLLTYELDAWVFRDELLYWCDKGYDYIGAPWFEGYIVPKTQKIIGVGNSGFSLRNVCKSIKILNRISRLKKFRRFWFDTKLQGLIPFLKVSFIVHFFKIDNFRFVNDLVLNCNTQNEDYFWTFNVKNTFSDFHVAPVEDATKFSFEVNPFHLYEKNEMNLPFGCHAWEKYEPEFWERYISISIPDNA